MHHSWCVYIGKMTSESAKKGCINKGVCDLAKRHWPGEISHGVLHRSWHVHIAEPMLGVERPCRSWLVHITKRRPSWTYLIAFGLYITSTWYSTHLTWHAFISKATLANGIHNQPRHVRIGRGVCASVGQYFHRPMSNKNIQGLCNLEKWYWTMIDNINQCLHTSLVSCAYWKGDSDIIQWQPT